MACGRVELTEEGRRYAEHGLPEKVLADALKSGPLSFDEARKRVASFDIGLQWAKKNGWVQAKDGKLVLVKQPGPVAEQEALKALAAGKEINPVILEKLAWRKLVRIESEAVAETKKLVGKEVADLTPELIRTGLWKDVRFRPYNVRAAGPRLNAGKLHILTVFEQKVRRIYLDLGFTETEGPFVESGFWNFDALYQPQDHPARDLADTFYMRKPAQAKLPEAYVDAVRIVHQNGGRTGSLGWRYKWSEAVARQNVMRTHDTAVSARSLTRFRPPFKTFCIGRVFRNETIDYKHLPEFVQVDGIVVDQNVCFKDLLGYLKEFFRRMGLAKVRFTPSYFPYTEMSTQVEVYFEDRKEWLELGGSGIFRPEVTEPLGIKEPVLAWGLGFERPIMLRLGMNDIRNFYYRNDLKMLREAKVLQ
ncbi:MAG: phenylalanine--tRNA ligase subunit alpha [Candidatus Aenigmatarchaeota archaeon]